MEKGILKIAVLLLKDYKEELSYRGCNDTTDEIRDLIEKEIGLDKFQKLAEEWNNGECEDAIDYDWIVTGVIIKQLEKLSK